MNFSEKLYTLRKERGLSQEQLAENLDVSRQAISKWESGRAVPETEKLLLISDYFGVSLDYLMKEVVTGSHTPPKNDFHSPYHTDARPDSMVPTDNIPTTKSVNILPGAIICISGILCLIVWGLLSIFNPTASAQISESSMIQIDGSGIFLLLSLIAVVTGAWLLFRNSRQK